MILTRTPILLIIFSLLLTANTGCNKKDNEPQVDKVYRFNETIMVDGLARTYTLNLPPNYYDAADFSLVIAMHGGGGDASQFESTSRLTDKANAAKFIIVYPEGVKSTGALGARTWNAGKCCDYAVQHNINDVNFISTLIDKLLATYKINPKKVYATGHSNGGMLTYRLACEIPDKIAAFAPNSSTMVVTKPCNPSRPVPVLHMHSLLDMNVPVNGGKGTSGLTNVYFPAVDSALNVLVLKNTCTFPTTADKTTYFFTEWNPCSSNSIIQYYLTKDGGHAWPGGLPGGGANADTPSTAINANDLIWDFFQQHQLP